MRYELTNKKEWDDIKLSIEDYQNTAKSMQELLDLNCHDCSDYLTKYYDELNGKIRYRCENCDFMISERNNDTLAIMETS